MRSKNKRFFNKIKTKSLLISVLVLGISNLIFIFTLFKPQILQYFQSFEVKKIQEEISPKKGYILPVKYGKLGPKMLESGVIDLEKFKQVYEQSKQPLSKEQINFLTKGSDNKIVINRENSYFLLNFFWAVGLGNQSKILSEGNMVNASNGQPGNFASTGGWTLGKDDSMNYYSKLDLIPLTQEQEDLVLVVSSNIYRPCCDNPTSFPDCNHGMALLGFLELMASQGKTEKEMYEAAKYINAYWFTDTYFDLAQYFKEKEKKDFSEIDAKLILGKNYSSASGFSQVKKWLTENKIIEEPQSGGGSCGV